MLEVFTAVIKSNYFTAACNGEITGAGGIYPTVTCPKVPANRLNFIFPLVQGEKLRKNIPGKIDCRFNGYGLYKDLPGNHAGLDHCYTPFEKYGFTYLPVAHGNSGHTDCAVWMIKDWKHNSDDTDFINRTE